MGLRIPVGKRHPISMPVDEIWDHQHTSDLWKAFASVLRVTAHPIIVQNTFPLVFSSPEYMKHFLTAVIIVK